MQRYNKFLIYANFFAYFLHFSCIFIVLERFFTPNNPKTHEKSTDRVVSASAWVLLVKAGGLYSIKASGSYSIEAGGLYSIEAGGVLIIDADMATFVGSR